MSQPSSAKRRAFLQSIISRPRRSTLIILAVIMLASGILGAGMLTRDLQWSDDWAGYFMQARALVEGSPSEFLAASSFIARNSTRPPGPVTYPWGYPLMLVPVVAAFGLSILPLKAVLTLTHVLCVPAYFLLARTRFSSGAALILTAILSLNPGVLNSQNELYADIPFLLFTLLALWLIEEYVNSEQRQDTPVSAAAAIGLAMFLAFFVRPNGLLLILPLALAQARRLGRRRGTGTEFASRNAVAFLLPYGILAGLQWLQVQLLPNALIPVESRFEDVSLLTLLENVKYYFWLPVDFFDRLLSGGSILYLLLLAAALVSLVRFRDADLPMAAFAFATLGGYIVFPGIQGIRYILPIIPIFMMFAFHGLSAMARSIGGGSQDRAHTLLSDLGIGLAVISFAASAQLAWSNLSADRLLGGRSRGAFSHGSSAVFEFVREHTPDDAIIIFFKPRTMFLRTNRLSFLTTECQDLTKGDYLVLFVSQNAYDQVSPERAPRCNSAVTLAPLYEELDFLIYRIDPAP